ncbi:hypothetical protein ABT010_19745 [Streptomyces sp. NPDC002668]|uniref:hypothetical protein n=1 Tax=Streptomyces sp. NPDC002668 TaxID=3154422 RepID=UPI00331D1A3B
MTRPSTYTRIENLAVESSDTSYSSCPPRAAGTSWKDKPGRMLGPDARWWAVAALRSEQVAVAPAQMLDLVDGYWEGRLPDGEVSLV